MHSHSPVRDEISSVDGSINEYAEFHLIISYFILFHLIWVMKKPQYKRFFHLQEPEIEAFTFLIYENFNHFRFIEKCLKNNID